MNKQEAIALMKQGVKITHRLFASDEWISYETLVDGTSRIVDEQGLNHTYNEFFLFRRSRRWDDGYSVWEPQEKPVTTKTSSTDNSIRQMILSNPEKVRELLLTDAALNIVMTVAQNGDAGVTAAEWARRFNDSIQSASQKLKNLWIKGYLTREEMDSPSGGIHHLYKVNEGMGL